MFHTLKGNKFQGFVCLLLLFCGSSMLLGKLGTFCPPEKPLCSVLRIFLFLFLFLLILFIFYFLAVTR